MHRLKILLSALFLLTIHLNLQAQIPLSSDAKITLLTCGPGDELYSVFGHTAIRVADPQTGMDTVYNFGTFDFGAPNFYLRFVKGDLQYYVSVSSYKEFVYQYVYFDRDVFEQELNLTATQKQEIADELNDILLSDRKFYTYKFIDRNCTTMVEDILNKSLPEKISNKNGDNGKTNREIIYSYLHNHFYENLGINLMFGYNTDKYPEKPFLPKQLMDGVSASKNGSKPLAISTTTVYERKETPSSPWWNSFFTYLAALILIAVGCVNKIVRQTYMAIAGLLGVFFLTVGLFSFHDEISLNYNALLINPIFLLILFFDIVKKRQALKVAIYACLVFHIIYLFLMFDKPHLLMVLPIGFLHGFIFWKLMREEA